jgi:glutaminyl-peptide cyclotransferase
LHVIPVPFPRTWHTKADNLDNIDQPTTMALLLLFRAFLFEYFSLAA